METNRLVAMVTAAVVAALLALTAMASQLHDDPSPPPADTAAGESAPPDRSVAPVVPGVILAEVGPAGRPPAPTQWARGTEPIPSNRWWSSAVAGPGAVSLWPQPLMVAIDGGTVRVASPAGEELDDGSVAADTAEAVVLELGADVETTVVDHGALHVRLRLRSTAVEIDLTLVQGSPVLEIESRRPDAQPLQLRVPGLSVDADGSDLDPTDGSIRFGTARGRWLVAGDRAFDVEVGTDTLELTPPANGRLVVGPVPAGATASYLDATQSIAAHRLLSTDERLTVDDAGGTTQELVQAREGSVNPGSLWALQPHHRRFADELPSTFGRVPSVLGPLPVVAAGRLRLRYPAVPVLWSAVAPPGGSAASDGMEPVPVEGAGSYFAGKEAYSYAAQADVLRAAGDDAGADAAIAEARLRVDRLVEPATSPSLHWEPTWGSVVIEPAEFGADSELNDHQLQYGYWVAAAAHIAEFDPDAAAPYRSAVDLLVADFAGAAAVPGATSSLPAYRTWSPYEGHSWSSGTAAFDAGNNLESISESTFAWWAAARWFVTTGRPEMAEPFLARLTIETALTGYQWLPDGDQLPEDPSRRPWSGVVWSGKVDLTTWFDPAPESALGIRLLPLGPASLSRYGTADALEAAAARWQWCDDHGGGCTARWANLLDSDAAVAGRAPLSGADPEPSTTLVMSSWWRTLWEQTDPLPGWRCTPGAVARVEPDGTVHVLASNPAPEPVAMRCEDDQGQRRWSGDVHGTHVETLFRRGAASDER